MERGVGSSFRPRERGITEVSRTLVVTVGTLAELRNELGIDHGKSERSAALARHARLALNVNVTVTVAEFILGTWQDRLDSGQLNDHAR
ncbi:abortive infection family protein [Cryobacterium sp. Hb1]|uniref:abortive infection family protein n=1 Tax=Cryobacterium sp. Hb1 TaxID=1259147 RepID=UPI00106ADCBF|nr:abortive infection family protein [Cryobacterium sp. Hb1]TFD66958.1 hypothetical protein E3T38_11220 [Cryobacterium sp. Hb1]